MKHIYLLAIITILANNLYAQTIIQRDAAIEEMVKEVNADSLYSYIQKLTSFYTRHTLSSTTEKTRGIGGAREWVVQKFREFGRNSYGRMTAFVDTITLRPDGRRVDVSTNLGNAMGILKGTDPNDDRIFMISGHLDSRVSDIMNRSSEAPGANDDGSGVAALIESARIMSKRTFPATIIFVAFSGEEQGLLGANFLAEKAKRENWNIEALLNNDIMGSNNSHDTRIINNTQLRIFSEAFSVQDTGRTALNIRALGLENDGAARQLARYVKETGERYVDHLELVLIYRNDRFLRGGDHTPFVQRKFAAVRLTEMNENFNQQHQDLRVENGVEYGDKIEFMDFEYLRKNTAVNLATLANLARSAPSPRDVKIDVSKLTNTTTLRWSAPATGKVKGYYILMRATSAPVWQMKFYTEANTMELPYSKDNYFFAVQSVNETGNESLPITPTVSR